MIRTLEDYEAVLGRRATKAEKIAFVLTVTRDDPAEFNRIVLGRELWEKQQAVCRSVVRNMTTVVPAGRAVGKSYLLAGLALWWAWTRPGSLVVATGVDHRQVVSILFKEIIRASRAGEAFGLIPDHISQGYASPQRLTIKEGTSWGILGFASRAGEGFSGQHDPQLLVIVDEASGILPPIWEAIHGLASTRLIVAGNPISHTSHFRELHDLAVAGSPSIATVPISSLECPDAQLEHSPRGMASKSFLRQMREIHGENSVWWRSNICGLFPGQESVQFVPRPWLDRCADESILSDPLWLDAADYPRWMGIDLGAGVGADRSVVVVRSPKRILEIFASADHGATEDSRQRLEPVVVEMAKRWEIPGSHVVFDQAGIGRNFASYLENHGLYGAVGSFGAGKGGKFYVNRRTANLFAAKRRFDPDRHGFVPFYVGGIPEWPALREELLAIRSPEMTMVEGQVKQVLEDKESMKSRLKRSPDVCDAFAATFTYSE